MALIKCEDCNHEYSEKANACPKCGCPTINNTIVKKRQNTQECSIKINGNEGFYKEPWKLYFKIFLFSIIIWILSIYLTDIKMLPTESFVPVGFVAFFTIVLMGFIVELCPKRKEEKKNLKIINEYFKKRFILLDRLPEHCSEKEIINKTNFTNEAVMFDVYMEAYKFNADAIVINDSNVTTHVRSSSSRKGSNSTSSTNKFHITATLIKY